MAMAVLPLMTACGEEGVSSVARRGQNRRADSRLGSNERATAERTQQKGRICPHVDERHPYGPKSVDLGPNRPETAVEAERALAAARQGEPASDWPWPGHCRRSRRLGNGSEASLGPSSPQPSQLHPSSSRMTPITPSETVAAASCPLGSFCLIHWSDLANDHDTLAAEHCEDEEWAQSMAAAAQRAGDRTGTVPWAYALCP